MAPPRKSKPKRNCLICNTEFELKSNGPSHSKQKYCSRKCTNVSRAEYVDRSWSLKCPVCMEVHKYSTRENYRRAIRDNRTMCILCRGRSNKGLKRTEEQRIKIAEKTREAMNKPDVWNKFINAMRSDEHREKKRILYVKQKEKCGKDNPLYNKTACEFFEQLNKELGWEGKHAENGGEVTIGGFWVDYYEPNINLVIEWDERHHRYEKKKKQDAYRAKYIIKKIGCKFLRIDQETLEIKEVTI